MVSSRASASSKLGPASDAGIAASAAGFFFAILPSAAYRLDPGVRFAARKLDRHALARLEIRGGADQPTVRRPHDAKAALQDEARRERAQPVVEAREPRAPRLEAGGETQGEAPMK